MSRTRIVASGMALLAASLVGYATTGRAQHPEIDQMLVCGTCHDLDEALNAPVPHAPVATGDCTACHNPHVSRFDALLRDRPGVVCVECHDDLKRTLEQPVVHPPVAEGRCADCHVAHGGEHAGLLIRESKELCRDCHEGLTEWEERSIQHPPFALGSCGDCHEPHGAAHPGLSAAAGGSACVACHSVDAGFKASHGGYPVERARCRHCHDPHASDRDGLFRDSLHAPFEEGDCTTCHRSPGASDPFAQVAGQAELCGTCHEEQVEQSRRAPFPHVSAGGGRCTDCHNPHSGDGESLLNDDMQGLCLNCHDPGGAKSGQEGRFLTHSELDCTACHTPHAGERPLMLKSESVELCGECHEHEHGIRHPLGEETRDPRTGHPMTCLSCHGMHDAPYEKYLLGSQERELCLGCHKDIGGGG